MHRNDDRLIAPLHHVILLWVVWHEEVSLDAAIHVVAREFNGREFATIVGAEDTKLSITLHLCLRLDRLHCNHRVALRSQER